MQSVYSHSEVSPRQNSHNVICICLILAVLHLENITTHLESSRHCIICPLSVRFTNQSFCTSAWNTVVIHQSIHHLMSEELADKQCCCWAALGFGRAGVRLIWLIVFSFFQRKGSFFQALLYPHDKSHLLKPLFRCSLHSVCITGFWNTWRNESGRLNCAKRMLEPKETNVASLMGELLQPYGASNGGNTRRLRRRVLRGRFSSDWGHDCWQKTSCFGVNFGFLLCLDPCE